MNIPYGEVCGILKTCSSCWVIVSSTKSCRLSKVKVNPSAARGCGDSLLVTRGLVAHLGLIVIAVVGGHCPESHTEPLFVGGR